MTLAKPSLSKASVTLFANTTPDSGSQYTTTLIAEVMQLTLQQSKRLILMKRPASEVIITSASLFILDGPPIFHSQHQVKIPQ